MARAASAESQMPSRSVLLVLVVLFVAACAAEPPPDDRPLPRPCDDGGSGGYVIDGVCL